ncbi:hypothetical protein WH47_01562 [Habropoda laboriosa]|uniref:Uncharacterized protein n=1 Tax=Habropoda laboriosa TaxID=597456 RepID=A0A0L7R0L3_9HYME|nr:hypothetical protein WH47_01562 [Habropoda laboriosa]
MKINEYGKSNVETIDLLINNLIGTRICEKFNYNFIKSELFERGKSNKSSGVVVPSLPPHSLLTKVSNQIKGSTHVFLRVAQIGSHY